ncbi:titin, partial [Plakobranchus ocellatus]
MELGTSPQLQNLHAFHTSFWEHKQPGRNMQGVFCSYVNFVAKQAFRANDSSCSNEELEEPESPTPEVVPQPEVVAVEEQEQQPEQEEVIQPEESLEESLPLSVITTEETSTEAAITETIDAVDQPIKITETEEASAAPEISTVGEITEIVPTEISQQETTTQDLTQEVDLVQAPDDTTTTTSISLFESLIDEIDEKVGEDVTLEVPQKPEEAPVESIEETFEFVQAEGERPIFLQTLQNVEAVEGQQVRFDVVVTGEPWPEIVWSLDGEVIRDSPVYRIESGPDGVCTLLLPEAFPEDEGEYECCATNVHGTASTKADLYVQDLNSYSEEVEQAKTQDDHPLKTSSPLPTDSLDNSDQEKTISQLFPEGDFPKEKYAPLSENANFPNLDTHTSTDKPEEALTRSSPSLSHESFDDSEDFETVTHTEVFVVSVPSFTEGKSTPLTPEAIVQAIEQGNAEELDMLTTDVSEDAKAGRGDTMQPSETEEVLKDSDAENIPSSTLEIAKPYDTPEDREFEDVERPFFSDEQAGKTSPDQLKSEQDVTRGSQPSGWSPQRLEPSEIEVDISFSPAPGIEDISESTSVSESTAVLTTIEEMSDEGSSTFATSVKDDLSIENAEEADKFKLKLSERDLSQLEPEMDMEGAAAAKPEYPERDVDDMLRKSPSLVTVSDRASLYGSTVSITTTDDAYTDDDYELSDKSSFLSSIEELAYPTHCKQVEFPPRKVMGITEVQASPSGDAPLHPLSEPEDVVESPVEITEKDKKDIAKDKDAKCVRPELAELELPTHDVSGMPSDKNTLSVPEFEESFSPEGDVQDLLTQEGKESTKSMFFDIPSISVTDDAQRRTRDMRFRRQSSQDAYSDRLQNAKSLMSSLVSIDVNVNEGRADKIIRRLSKTPEMISVTQTLRESSLQPDQQDIWSSRRSSFYSQFDDSSPFLEHMPPPEALRNRRPSMRRDSETVIKETVVSTPAVAVRAQETIDSEQESDSDGDLEDGDDTIMQINISFEGLRQRISSEQTTRSEERRRSVSSSLDFSPTEVPFRRSRSLSESFSRRSSLAPGSDRIDEADESVDLDLSHESADFQFPEVNVETEVEDTTDENIQETVLEVADKVFVTVRSEKSTNTISDISIKIAAKDLAPGLLQGGSFLGLPGLVPGGGAAAKDQPQQEDKPSSPSKSSADAKQSEDAQEVPVSMETDEEKVPEAGEEIQPAVVEKEEAPDKDETDFTEKVISQEDHPKLSVETEKPRGLSNESGENITNASPDERQESLPVGEEARETQNIELLKQSQSQPALEASTPYPEGDASLKAGDTLTENEDIADHTPSLEQVQNTFTQAESSIPSTPQTQHFDTLEDSDGATPLDQPRMSETISIPHLDKEETLAQRAWEEERCFEGGDAEVLAEQEESLSEKEKLVTAEIEKEEESDEEKKEISPLPLEQPVVEEVQDERFAPVVKRPLQNISSHDGGQARFEAEVEGLPTPTITWFKDGQVLHPSEEFDIAYSEENVASLYIHDVLPEDAGTYVVQATNELGTVTSEATLHVDAAEVSDVSVEETSGIAPTFTVKPTFQTVDEKETATFTATIEAVPQPEILWTKDNSPIPEDDTRFTTTLTQDGEAYTTTMEVKEVTTEDAGTYKVTASNDLGDTSVTVSLIVNKTQEEKTDFRDQLATAEFEIPEKPQEEAEQKDFREVLQTEVKTKVGVKYQVEQMDFRHMLKASKSKAKKFSADVDAEATVTEEAPEAEQIDFRAVLRGPVSAPEQQVEDTREAPEFIKPIEDVQVREGESATFECRVKGEPQPQVMWYHDQQPIKSDSVYQITQGDEGQFTLFIPEVFPEDSGVYTARAFNDVSDAETSATLTVTELASETSSVTSKEDQPEQQDIQIDIIQAEAATKIQSAFRGFKAREEVKLMKQATSEVTVDVSLPAEEEQRYEEEIEISLVKDEPETEETVSEIISLKEETPKEAEEEISQEPEEETIIEKPEDLKEDIIPAFETVPEVSATEVTDIQALDTSQKIPDLETSVVDSSVDSVQSVVELAQKDVQVTEVDEGVEIVEDEDVAVEDETKPETEIPSESIIEDSEKLPEVAQPEEQKVEVVDEHQVEEDRPEDTPDIVPEIVDETVQEEESAVVDVRDEVTQEVKEAVEDLTEEKASDTAEEVILESVTEDVSDQPSEEAVVSEREELEVEAVMEDQAREVSPEETETVTQEIAVDSVVEIVSDTTQVEEKIDQEVIPVEEEQKEESAPVIEEDVDQEVVEETIVESKAQDAKVEEMVKQSVQIIADKQKEDGVEEETEETVLEQATEVVSEGPADISETEEKPETVVSMVSEDQMEETATEVEEEHMPEVVEELITETKAEDAKVRQKIAQSVQPATDEGLEKETVAEDLSDLVPETATDSVSEAQIDSAEIQKEAQSEAPVVTEELDEESATIVEELSPEALEDVSTQPEPETAVKDIAVEQTVLPIEEKPTEDATVEETVETVPESVTEVVTEDQTDLPRHEENLETEVSVVLEEKEEETAPEVEEEGPETIEETVLETEKEIAEIEEKAEQKVEFFSEQPEEDISLEDTEDVVSENVAEIISEDKTALPEVDEDVETTVSVISEESREDIAPSVDEEAVEFVEETVTETKTDRTKVEERIQLAVQLIADKQKEEGSFSDTEEIVPEMATEDVLEDLTDSSKTEEKIESEVPVEFQKEDEESVPEVEEEVPEIVEETIVEAKADSAKAEEKVEQVVQILSETQPEETTLEDTTETIPESVEETVSEKPSEEVEAIETVTLEVDTVIEHQDEETTKDTAEDVSPDRVAELVLEEQTESAQVAEREEVKAEVSTEKLKEEVPEETMDLVPETVEETVLETDREHVDMRDKEALEVEMLEEKYETETTREESPDVLPEVLEESVTDQPSEAASVSDKAEMEVSILADAPQEEEPLKDTSDVFSLTLAESVIETPSEVADVEIEVEQEISELTEEQKEEVAAEQPVEDTRDTAVETVFDKPSEQVATAEEEKVNVDVTEEDTKEETAEVTDQEKAPETVTEVVSDIPSELAEVGKEEEVKVEVTSEEPLEEATTAVKETETPEIASEAVLETPTDVAKELDQEEIKVDLTLDEGQEEAVTAAKDEEAPEVAQEAVLELPTEIASTVDEEQSAVGVTEEETVEETSVVEEEESPAILEESISEIVYDHADTPADEEMKSDAVEYDRKPEDVTEVAALVPEHVDETVTEIAEETGTAVVKDSQKVDEIEEETDADFTLEESDLPIDVANEVFIPESEDERPTQTTEVINVDALQQDVSEAAESLDDIPEDYSAFEETVDQLLKDKPTITSEHIRVDSVKAEEEEEGVSEIASIDLEENKEEEVPVTDASVEISQPETREVGDEEDAQLTLSLSQPDVEDVETKIAPEDVETENIEADFEFAVPVEVVEDAEGKVETEDMELKEEAIEAEIKIKEEVEEKVKADFEIKEEVEDEEEVEAEIESKEEVKEEEVEDEIEIQEEVTEEEELRAVTETPQETEEREVEAGIAMKEEVEEEVEAVIEIPEVPEEKEVEAEIEIKEQVEEEVEAVLEISEESGEKDVEAETKIKEEVGEEVEVVMEVPQEIEEKEAVLEIAEVPEEKEVEAEIEIKEEVEEVEAEIEMKEEVAEEVEAVLEIPEVPEEKEVEAEIEIKEEVEEEVEAVLEIPEESEEKEVEAEIEIKEEVEEEVAAEIEMKEEVEAKIEMNEEVEEEVEAKTEIQEEAEEKEEVETKLETTETEAVADIVRSDFVVDEVDAEITENLATEKDVTAEDLVEQVEALAQAPEAVEDKPIPFIAEAIVPEVSDSTTEIAPGASLSITPSVDVDTTVEEVVQIEAQASIPASEEEEGAPVVDFTLPAEEAPEDVEEELIVRAVDVEEAVEDVTVDVEVEEEEPVSEEVTLDVTFAPQFLSDLSDQEVNEGDTLILEVNVTGAPKPEVKWFQNDVQLAPTDRYDISEVDTTYSLTIRDVQEEDDAEYTVTATNTAGQASSSAEVIVNLPGEAPSFVSHLSDISVEFNAPIVLEAKVKGEPTPEVTWTFQGQPLTDTRYRVEQFEDNVSLTIDRSESVDTGEFTVLLTNKHGKASSTSHVTVTMTAPVFTQPLHPEVKVKVGDTADLTCEVTGIPRPEVQWFRGDELVTEGPEYKTVYQDTAASLRILEVSPEDSTVTFTCKAVNPAGEATTVTKLLPQEPARILTKPQPVDVFEGEPVHLAFTIQGLPQPTVEWSVEGSAILPDDNHMIEQPTDEEVTLTIPSAQASDTANYTLTVTNDAGRDSASVGVTVNKPVEEEIIPEQEETVETRPEGEAPEFLLTIKTQTVLPGETVDFTCEVTGKPRPQLSWVYNGRTLEDEGRYMIFEEEGLHHLEVYEVCPEDVGEYTVTAQNEHGQVSCSADLKLKELPAEQKAELEAPKFIVAIETVEACVGETATFTCKATGKPTPELLWYKNDKPIASEDKQFTVTSPGEGESSLVVVDLRPEHDGTYTCEAKNEAGTAKCKAELFVEEKPEDKAEAPEFIKVPEKVTVREHDNAKFLVKVIGQPKPT